VPFKELIEPNKTGYFQKYLTLTNLDIGDVTANHIKMINRTEGSSSISHSSRFVRLRHLKLLKCLKSWKSLKIMRGKNPNFFELYMTTFFFRLETDVVISGARIKGKKVFSSKVFHFTGNKS
jgi:hypothetical protein